LVRSKLPGNGQIPAEQTQLGGKTVNSDWDKEGCPQQWNKPINVPTYKKGARTDCDNYQDISQL
jgi:hypothetical protein